MSLAKVSNAFLPLAFLAGAIALAGCASDGDTGKLEPAHLGSDAIGPANPRSSADTGASYLGSGNSANTSPGGATSASGYGK